MYSDLPRRIYVTNMYKGENIIILFTGLFRLSRRLVHLLDSPANQGRDEDGVAGLHGLAHQVEAGGVHGVGGDTHLV